MAKIPTYQSRGTPSGRVARPNLPDYTVNIANKVVNASNKILDAKAVDEGYKAGKEEQANNLELNNQLLEQPGYTLRSEAYNKGANAAYVAGMKTKAEDGLTDIAMELNDPLSTVPIDDRMKIYEEKKNALRGDFVTDIPSYLQADLSNYFDSLDTRYGNQVFNNQRNLQVNEIKTTIANRVDNALDNFPALIRDGGYLENELLEEQFSDLVAAIDEGLGIISPATALNYKQNLKQIMQVSAIQNAYDNAEDKEAFIQDLEQGGDIYKNIMRDVNESFFDGDEDVELPATGVGGYKTLAKSFRVDLKNDKALMATDRAIWEQDATTALNLYKAGVNPDYVFDAQQMKGLGFSDVAIEKYRSSFEIANEVYPEIIEARSTAPNDNKNLLKALQSEFYQLQAKDSLTSEDRKDLLIIQAQIEGVGLVLANQQKYISDGDINLLMDQAGITYDTSTTAGLQDYHNKALTNFGLSSDLMKVAPQSQIDADKELFMSGNFADVQSLADKYGKYFETFIVDAELQGTGYETVGVMFNQNPKLAEQMFNAIQDFEKNDKTAKNINANYSGAEGDLSVFVSAFQDEYLDFIVGNQDMANDITNAAQALWLQTYIRTGDENKATKGVLDNFSKNFQKFDFNGMKVILPNGVDTNIIRDKLQKFADHPQKFGIMTGSNFDINDFKEDFADNTFDNYGLALDGGKLKIINKENAMFVTTIVKKLPSASGELTYTNSIVINDNEQDNVEHLETKDTVDIWDYESNITNVTADGDQTVSYNQSIDNQITAKEIEYETQKTLFDNKEKQNSENINLDVYDKYKEFDTDGDGNISGSEYANLLEAQQNNRVEEPLPITTYEQIETMLFEYAKLKNPPVDEYVNTVSKDRATQDQLQAISMYIKNGELTDYIIDYLSDLESFSALRNDAVATEVMLNWKDNMSRTTDEKPPVIMTPIHALYDFVRDLEDSNNSSQSEALLNEIIETTEDGTQYIPF